jgi:3-oxoacyl-(acyl-carrier-protein) synthase
MTAKKKRASGGPRICVTGLGAVSSLGHDLPALWEGLSKGACGLRPLTRLDPETHRISHGGEVPPLPESAFGKVADPAVRYILVAAEEALAQAGLDKRRRRGVGLVLGSNFGAMASTERFLKHPAEPGRALEVGGLHAAPLAASLEVLKLRGPAAALSLSCASGNAAIGAARDMLRTGQCETVLAVGYDAISEVVWAGLAALRAMTRDALLPFDKRRNGTIFSEGAGALVLESADRAGKRDAEPLAEVLGYGTSSNAHHMTHPDPGGAGMARAMAAALKDARIEPDAVGHINAHATGTASNDKLETAAIKTVFGPHAAKLAVNGIKSMIGHAMGAASALEAVASVMTLREGLIPPTLGLEEPDPACDLDCVPGEARRGNVDVALNNSAGFGGCNAAVIFKRWEG